jgi:flagellar protein FliS
MSNVKAGALNKYSQVAVQANTTYASPHRLIQMLLEGALEKIATAKGHLARGSIANKGQQISWALSIIGGLRASLDMSAGGEIAQNLFNLYDYMERRLLHANLRNDVAALNQERLGCDSGIRATRPSPGQRERSGGQGAPSGSGRRTLTLPCHQPGC